MNILFRATIFFLLVLLLLPAAHAEAGTDSPFQRENHIETLAPEEDAPLEETKAIYEQCAHTYVENDLKAAERQRDAALNGNMPLLFAVYALTWLEEDSGRSPGCGAPAAFWEQWIVRMLGEREGWYRMGLALFALAEPYEYPAFYLEGHHVLRVSEAAQRSSALKAQSKAALRRAADRGHPEAMYALARLAPYIPDGQFRMPEHPGIPVVPPTDADGGGPTPDARYWMSAAAAHGSARANYVLGLVYGDRHTPFYDEEQSAAFFRKAVRLGLVLAAEQLSVVFNPRTDRDFRYRRADAGTSLYYALLAAHMRGEACGSPPDALPSPATNKPALSDKEREEIRREAEQECTRIRADLLAKREAREALYAKAEPLFAALCEAFDAQAEAAADAARDEARRAEP